MTSMRYHAAQRREGTAGDSLGPLVKKTNHSSIQEVSKQPKLTLKPFSTLLFLKSYVIRHSSTSR